MSLVTLLLILLVVSVVFGGWGYSRPNGGWYWSPAGIVLLVLLLALLGVV
jgi:hypothetical protein